jgi:hypothetical protein
MLLTELVLTILMLFTELVSTSLMWLSRYWKPGWVYDDMDASIGVGRLGLRYGRCPEIPALAFTGVLLLPDGAVNLYIYILTYVYIYI